MINGVKWPYASVLCRPCVTGENEKPECNLMSCSQCYVIVRNDETKYRLDPFCEWLLIHEIYLCGVVAGLPGDNACLFACTALNTLIKEQQVICFSSLQCKQHHIRKPPQN